jgi:hypothetical protein
MDPMNFVYPFEVLRALGERYGFHPIRLDDYAHPRGQAMMRITALR